MHSCLQLDFDRSIGYIGNILHLISLLLKIFLSSYLVLLKFLWTGDKVLVAIKGQKRKAVLVGLKQNQKAFVPKFDSNNIVLIEDNGTPIGTRIHVPVPSVLRQILRDRSVAKVIDFTKLLSIAPRFV